MSTHEVDDIETGVSIKSAALQFSLANPAVTEVIPAAFRHELREQKLVARDAPLPVDFTA